MKFLLIIMGLGIALAIAEAKGRDQGVLGRNVGAPGKRRYQGRPFNRNQRGSLNRFVRPIRPLPVILEKPEKSNETVIAPQPVENTLIQNVVKNPIDDVAELLIDGLVEKPDSVSSINVKPVYEIAEENLIKSLVKNPFEGVNGTFNGILGIPDVQIDPIFVNLIGEPDFEVHPIIETLESVKETLIKSVVKNLFAEILGNSKEEQTLNVNLGKPDVQIHTSVVSIVGEPDFEVSPTIETLESAQETLIKSVVKNPFQEILGNSEEKGILGKPDIQINPSVVPIMGEPDFEVSPTIETLESAQETLIKSVVKNEEKGNLGKPDVQINPSVVSIVGEPDKQTDLTIDSLGL